MGCDIHGFIEYKAKDEKDWRSKSWHNFGAEFHLDRNYIMFAFLAGVRNYWEDKGLKSSVYNLKGIPDDIGFWTQDSYYMYISDDLADDDYRENTISRKRAIEWVDMGLSKYYLFRKDENVALFVSNPDYHTPSWLTLPEYRNTIDAAINFRNTKFPEEGQVGLDWAAEYLGVLAAMAALEIVGYETRFVFWFDN